MDKKTAPGVLWSVPPDSPGGWYSFEILADGSVWSRCYGKDEWSMMNSDELHPAIRELARRLLAERAEQEKLDEHNDQVEEAPIPPSRLYPDLIERRLIFLEKRDSAQIEENNDMKRRLDELDKNLAREIEQHALETKESRRNRAVYERVQADLAAKVEGLEARLGRLVKDAAKNLNGIAIDVRRLDADVALLRDAAAPPQGVAPFFVLCWDRTQGIMVDGNDKIVLDLSDYFEDGNMSPKDHDLLGKLVALWNAWGEGGYLRKRLETESCKTIHWFDQLRSELLAKPWKEGA